MTLCARQGLKGHRPWGSVPREGAWRWLGMICLWRSGTGEEGDPSNKFPAGVLSAQGGAGSGVRLALPMDPVVFALCPVPCHLTCHVSGEEYFVTLPHG